MNKLQSQLLRRRAFSLVEVVLSLLIIGIIALGMQSAMVLASRAAPDRNTPNNSAIAAASAIDQLSADLTYASTIVSATSNVVEFTVPDRNNDNSPETIRYSWSGVSGDPLLRSINGRTAATIATNVQQLLFTYDKRSQLRDTTYTESGETLLSSYDGAGLLNLGDFDVDDKTWVGQYFKPTLPNGAVKWRVTRARVKVRKNSSDDGIARIQIRAANGTTPGAVIEEGYLWESVLSSSYSWVELACSNVSGRTPGSALCIVIQNVTGTADPCRVQYQALLAGAVNSDMVKTANGGASWTTPAGQDMVYYVWGTYSTANAAVTDYWLTNVRCTMRCGSDPVGKVHTTFRVFNEPQITGP